MLETHVLMAIFAIAAPSPAEMASDSARSSGDRSDTADWSEDERPALRIGLDYSRYVAAVGLTETIQALCLTCNNETNPLARYVSHEFKLGLGFDFGPGRGFNPIGVPYYFRFRGGPSMFVFTWNADQVQALARDFDNFEVPTEGKLGVEGNDYTAIDYISRTYDYRYTSYAGLGAGAFLSLDACKGRRERVAGCIGAEVAGVGIPFLHSGGVKAILSGGIHRGFVHGKVLTTFKFMLNFGFHPVPKYTPYPSEHNVTTVAGFWQYGFTLGVDLGRASK